MLLLLTAPSRLLLILLLYYDDDATINTTGGACIQTPYVRAVRNKDNTAVTRHPACMMVDFGREKK